jgi:beta-phosphoglucomutase-like phosphatase (HAD superfamily)
MPQITTLLFDCDNTLVLSEELAFEACADVANQLLEKHGVSKRYTGPELIKDYVGQNFRGMLVSIQKDLNFQISPEELEENVEKELGAVTAKLKEKAQPCVGVMEELERLHESKKYKFAVVSSSAYSRVHASVVKVGQDKFFPAEFIYSAATSLPVPTTKPDPAIYNHAMKELGVKGEECVAIEDSKSGTLSGVRAGIHVVGYVGPYPEDEQEKMVKVLTDAGAKIIMHHWKEFPACLEKIEKGEI